MITLLPFRCHTCDMKCEVPVEPYFPDGAAMVKGQCLECLEKHGPQEDEFLTQEEYDLLLARENPNQLSLL